MYTSLATHVSVDCKKKQNPANSNIMIFPLHSVVAWRSVSLKMLAGETTVEKTLESFYWEEVETNAGIMHK